jgi:hypothetical protein
VPGRRLAAAATLAALLLVSPAGAEFVQDGGLRVGFSGGVSPHALPRAQKAPVAVSLGGEITTTDGMPPPQLQTIAIAVNRHARLDYRGLPSCRYHQIQPASTREAIASCPGGVVGRGSFRAAVVLPEQSPFPSRGKVVAFNGLLHGKHVLFAHIFGTQPLPQSAVIVFRFGHEAGAFGLTLRADLPQVTAEWGHVSGVELTLKRTFTYRGSERSFLSASCPAPAGFTEIPSPLARVSFGFEDGRVLGTTLVRSCRATSPAVARR